jgi:hypothetical protein
MDNPENQIYWNAMEHLVDAVDRLNDKLDRILEAPGKRFQTKIRNIQKQDRQFPYEEFPSLESFVVEKLVATDNMADEIQAASLFQMYADYCSENNLSQSTASKFYRQMNKLFKKVRTRVFAKYVGIKLQKECHPYNKPFRMLGKEEN